MPHAVLLGDPTFFRIKGGKNPYTRDVLGFRKKVDRQKAISQWQRFKETLERLGARVLVMPPEIEYPGMAFPANAGFLHPKYGLIPLAQKTFYLSHLLAHREGERKFYRGFFEKLGVATHATPYVFEGEADFFPCGDFFIFSYGEIMPTGFRPRLGFPPWQYQFSHRSDERNLSFLKSAVQREVIPVRLTDTRFYHGDTVFFAFGPKRESLLAYLEAVDPGSRAELKRIFGSKLIALSQKDAQNFVANSFQLDTPNGPHLVLPSGVSEEIKKIISGLGFPYTLVDVSEFFEKGGGSIKCLVCDLGPDDVA